MSTATIPRELLLARAARGSGSLLMIHLLNYTLCINTARPRFKYFNTKLQGDGMTSPQPVGNLLLTKFHFTLSLLLTFAESKGIWNPRQPGTVATQERTRSYLKPHGQGFDHGFTKCHDVSSLYGVRLSKFWSQFCCVLVLLTQDKMTPKVKGT